jgi:hypothetical protein
MDSIMSRERRRRPLPSLNGAHARHRLGATRFSDVSVVLAATLQQTLPELSTLSAVSKDARADVLGNSLIRHNVDQYLKGIVFKSGKAGVRADLMLRAQRTRGVPSLMSWTLPGWPDGLKKQPLDEYRKTDGVIALAHGCLHNPDGHLKALWLDISADPLLKTVLLNGLGRTLDRMHLLDGSDGNAGAHIAPFLQILVTDVLPALERLFLYVEGWYNRFRFSVEVKLPKLTPLEICFWGSMFPPELKLPELRCLSLSGAGDPGFGSEDAMDFTDSVNSLAALMLRGGHPSLTRLSITYCGLGDVAFQPLARALSACPRLGALILRVNNIGLVGARAIWRQVPPRKFHLDFSGNDALLLDLHAMAAMRKAMDANRNLTIGNDIM